MGDKHRVRFDPVDLEIEVDEDETILDAAFRQGITLMHGCREGQCAACKSFLLDGDLQLDRYSTFALADYELEEGYVLLCKGHAYSDLDIELINYDEETLRSAKPLRDLTAEVVEVAGLTHDISLLRLRPLDGVALDYHPGQYVDITIPGTSEHRSFSMATTPATPGELQFVIKRYPGGRFSGLLEGGPDGIAAGHELALRGPYGAFTLRERSERPLLFIGGGAGMAPILSLLRHMTEAGVDRPAVYYYGARTAADLFYLDELKALENVLPDFRFVPCLSESNGDGSATGAPGELECALGLVTEVVERGEPELAERDCYLCGPPPMIDAAMALLTGAGVPHDRIFYDKFTTTAPG
ncbi:2Fe-2S iron-sulfur cluster binding domain-containing protein [Actinomadura barringtoniae]|uniref:2Fe-2S iron-sulfur cluster binding domain-containing protein n=1 Tax=Actinomadura barringtoniae TaxID=1427535 RepID=A0A939T855_9ACTN|nr:2Fe-2S iron-sulfur cluster binding domain-containing protein [Actinomadura barringtoniae]MBO2453788.1 2Fe-2S iron-sulfur cluster binding domain-containing protein [Actinomadura barringtoniae]